MFFQLSEEQEMIRRAARNFAQQECKPGVIERDEKQQFPREQIMKLAELGFLGMMVKSEYGGAGMDTISYVLGDGRDQQDRCQCECGDEREQQPGMLWIAGIWH